MRRKMLTLSLVSGVLFFLGMAAPVVAKNSCSQHGWTSTTVETEPVNVIQNCLDNGADPNRFDSGTDEPPLKALYDREGQQKELFWLLIENGADPSYAGTYDGMDYIGNAYLRYLAL